SYLFLYYSYLYLHPSYLLSFPTRRSSDLVRLFIEILEQLKENYVDPISDKDLMTNAIKGMLSGLDPHSTFYTQDEYESAKESTSDRKSTRLNSSHVSISYAVFCLKKKKS